MKLPETHFSDELEPFEMLMFRGERNPLTRSSIMALLLLDKTPDFESLKRTFDRASRRFIRLRQRVIEPSLAVANARWVVDPDFDIDFHLRRVTAPAAGQLQDILAHAGQLLSDPLDLERPLWITELLEGVQIEGTEAALLMKLHHSVTDGIGGMMLFRELFSSDPDAPERPMPLLPVPEVISDREIVRKALLKRAGQFIPNLRKNMKQGLQLGNHILSNPRDLLTQIRDQVNSANRVIGKLPAPPSPVLRERSIKRRLGVTEAPLAALRSTAKASGATINDAYLAAVAGGLRRYHQHLNSTIDALAISMPVNTRKTGDASGGNSFTGARLLLPISEPDPSRRMKLIHQRVKKAIREPALNLINDVAPLLMALPEEAMHTLAGVLKIPDIQISNVPGSPVPLYLDGCLLQKIYPFGPVPGVAAMITMNSSAGTCYVGVNMDTAAIKDGDLFMQCLEQGFAETIGSFDSDAGNAKTVRREQRPGKQAGNNSAKSGRPARESE